MKKKILFCIQNLDIGGPQKSLLALLYEFDYDRFDVDLMIWSQKGSLIRFLPNQVNVIEISDELAYLRLSKNSIKDNSLSLICQGKGKLVRSAILFSLRYIRNMNVGRQKFWRALHSEFPVLEGEYDVAIAVSGGNLCYFIVDCVNAKKRITWVRTDYRVLLRDKAIDREYFHKADKIITVSDKCRTILINEFPELSAEKIQVFSNLLPFKLYDQIETDTSVFNRTGDKKILLSVTRIDPNKGLDIAVEAMKILKMNGDNVVWYILGDGVYRRTLKKLINRAGLEDDIFLIGFKDNPYAYIKECDIFLHPSRFEGKSNAVEEAKFALKAIVVTNYSTVSDQITHLKTGYVVEMDAVAISDGIERVLFDKKLVSDFIAELDKEKKASINKVENFYALIENGKTINTF